VTISLSRKRKKELRRLQGQANDLWDAQQHLLGEAATVAREAGRQLGNFNREHVVPVVNEQYDARVRPYVDRGYKIGRQIVNDRVVPALGAAAGTALSVVDAANAKRRELAQNAGFVVEPPKKSGGIGAGGIIAILLGVAAAVGIAYAAWQTLRADDELWVADDPLAAPEQ
jgi:hypothetical protein